MHGDFIKISRKIQEWEWYKDSTTSRLFLHCLINANWKDGRFQGVEIPRGSFATGRKRLSAEIGVSEQQIRTAMKHLESIGEITTIKYSKFTVITVNNYNNYQSDNHQITSNQPAINQQLTTIEESKNSNQGIKEEEKIAAVALFNELWEMYPKRVGKHLITIFDQISLLKVGRDEMLRAIRRYQKVLDDNKWRQPQSGSTFFTRGYLEFLDDKFPEETKLVIQETGETALNYWGDD